MSKDYNISLTAGDTCECGRSYMVVEPSSSLAKEKLESVDIYIAIDEDHFEHCTQCGKPLFIPGLKRLSGESDPFRAKVRQSLNDMMKELTDKKDNDDD